MRSNRRGLLPLLILFLTLIPWSLAAHPHMSLEASLEFEYQQGDLIGVWQEWRFDRFFSGSILQSYDWDGNGLFDSQENEAVFAGAFSNLKNYDYFTSYRTGGKRRVPEEVEGFSARMENGILVYRFYIPLRVEDRNVWIAVFDPTYFCAVSYGDPAAAGSEGTSLAPRYGVEENKDHPVYYNPLSPANDNTRYDQWEPGLETAFPEEIHVRY